MDWIAFSFYRYVLLPAFYVIVRIIVIFNFKNGFFDTLHFRLKNKFHFNPSFDKTKKSIGFHAASGEIEYAFPLIRKIKEIHPNYNIVVTLSSTSVLNSVLNRPEVDAIGPAPLDLFWRVETFLNQFSFQLFLFSRTDVWPELSWQLEKSKIPSILFAATFSKKSSKKTKIENSLTRWALNLLTHIFTVSDEDSDNLKSIHVRTPIQNLGDTRYDQVLHKKTAVLKDLPKLETQKPVFVAGSTWKEDESVLLPAFLKVSNQWNFVIAPHEVDVENIENLESFFAKRDLKTVRLSRLIQKPEVWDVLIVDMYGYLFHLYAWADLTFVGGSFKSKVHSVMEPLSFFKPVCVGPYYSNNREAIEFSEILVSSLPLTWVQIVANSSELESVLNTIGRTSRPIREKMQSELSSLISQRQGASDRTYVQIQRYL